MLLQRDVFRLLLGQAAISYWGFDQAKAEHRLWRLSEELVGLRSSAIGRRVDCDGVLL
jgi:hypothetical protein